MDVVRGGICNAHFLNWGEISTKVLFLRPAASFTFRSPTRSQPMVRSRLHQGIGRTVRIPIRMHHRVRDRLCRREELEVAWKVNVDVPIPAADCSRLRVRTFYLEPFMARCAKCNRLRTATTDHSPISQFVFHTGSLFVAGEIRPRTLDAKAAQLFRQT